MIELIKAIFRIYNYKIIGIFFLIFVICILPIGFIPDFFNIENLDSPKSLILQLLGIIVSFSGIIITILLLIYNFYLKSLPRNTVEIIIENKWFKLNLTLFSSIILYFFTAYFVIEIQFSITLIYSIIYISVFYIFIQFPLIVLILKNSSSTNAIRNLIKQIDNKQLDEFYRPKFLVKDSISYSECLEKNPIMKLKDIGLNAIREKDWVIPQNIMVELYELLIASLTNKTEEYTLYRNLNSWLFICIHFKTEIFQNNDYLTLKALLSYLKRAYKYLTSCKIHLRQNNSLDKLIKEIYRKIVSDNEFYTFQSNILDDAKDIIKYHYESCEYSDETLQTIEYRLELKEKGKPNINSDLLRWWHYITNELLDIFFDTLTTSIEFKNKNVYEYFGWKIQSLYSIIYDSEKLTEFQKEDAVKHLTFKARTAVSDAIENEIYVGLDYLSSNQIVNWVKEERKFATYSILHFSSLLQKLSDVNQLGFMYIDEFFMIGRQLVDKDISSIGVDIVKFILEKGIELFEKAESDSQAKLELKKQIDWLSGYFDETEELKKIKEKNLRSINAILNFKLHNA